MTGKGVSIECQGKCSSSKTSLEGWTSETGHQDTETPATANTERRRSTWLTKRQQVRFLQGNVGKNTYCSLLYNYIYIYIFIFHFSYIWSSIVFVPFTFPSFPATYQFWGTFGKAKDFKRAFGQNNRGSEEIWAGQGFWWNLRKLRIVVFCGETLPPLNSQ